MCVVVCGWVSGSLSQRRTISVCRHKHDKQQYVLLQLQWPSIRVYERRKIRKGFEVLLYCTLLSSLSHSCGFTEENIVMYRAYNVLHQRAQEHVSLKAYNILISSLCFVLSPSSLWFPSLSTYKKNLAETPMCAEAKTNLWENTFDCYCPTFSHHLLSPSVPSSFPSMQTLLGCRECTLSKSRDKFKPRYERELPNDDWHTDIQRGGKKALGRDEKAWTERYREQQGGGASHFQ